MRRTLCQRRQNAAAKEFVVIGMVLKIWKWMAIAGVVLVIVVLAGVWMALNGIVRRAVEYGATASLQTPTTLGSATLSPFGGSVGLNHLAVASPEGFRAPQIFTLGKVGVSTNGFGKLFGSPVRVSHVTLAAPQLVIEQAGGKLNLTALSEKLKGAGTDAPKPADTKSEPVRVVIDRLDITDAVVAIRPGIPGLEQEYRVTLPSVTLNNIGNVDTGDSVGRVLQQVAATLAAKAAENDNVPDRVKQLLTLDFTQIQDKLKDQAKEELQKATEKFGDLLGGKKKNSDR